jgi:glycosyltransferase involved in cell wall biosynthesis
MRKNLKWHFQNLIVNPQLILFYSRHALKYIIKRNISNFDLQFSKISELDQWYEKNLFSGVKRSEEIDAIDWIIPDFSEFSGGHKTISRLCLGLEKVGVKSNFVLTNSTTKEDFRFQKNLIKKKFGLSNFTVNSIRSINHASKMSIATSWESAVIQSNYPSSQKMYFIQDLESLFYPASSESAVALWTYSLPTQKIVLGNWLARQMEILGTKAELILPFGVSKISASNLEHKRSDQKVIVVYCQPSKERRGTPLLLEVLRRASKELSDYKVIVVGESFHQKPNFGNNIKFLGSVSESDMLKLFKPGRIGLVISHSNPSLVPFEMLNHGMFVCTNSEWSNNFDLTMEGVEFFAPLPSETLNSLKRAIERANFSDGERIGNLNHLDWNEISKRFSDFVIGKLRN